MTDSCIYAQHFIETQCKRSKILTGRNRSYMIIFKVLNYAMIRSDSVMITF